MCVCVCVCVCVHVRACHHCDKLLGMIYILITTITFVVTCHYRDMLLDIIYYCNAATQVFFKLYLCSPIYCHVIQNVKV